MTDVVLYIEDNADNIRLVQRLLRRRGEIELQTAATGREGVQSAVDLQPRLILLDNRLPDAAGKDVLRQLRASEATAAIPVVIVSGDSGGQIADELLAEGAAGFLAKPFDIHQFLAMIDSYLG
jgi:two-component system, cell cycle response regulator DivK